MNKMKRVYGSVLLCLLTFSMAKGQDISVTAAFDTSRILIGDQISFTVTVDQPSGIKLSLPQFRDTLSGNIEILSGPVRDSLISPDGKLKITDKYIVTSFNSGHYQLDPVYTELKTESGVKRFYSDYSRLEVERVNIAPADTTAKIFDIIQPYRAPVTIGEVFPWILLVILGAAFIYFITGYLRKLRKSKSEVVPQVNPDPAHVVAFRELEKLKAQKLWQKGEIKKYYTRLTEILRQYLEDRYSVYSMELTTSETLEALIKTGFTMDESFNKLKMVLNGGDLVKFAKYKPEPTENEMGYDYSWDFVVATRKEESAEIKEKVKEESL